jgi:hypothetical protein
MVDRSPAKLSGRHPLACVAVLLACGCLSEGDPGIGQRAVAGRGFAGLTAGTGAERPLFFTLPAQPVQQGRPARDLHVLRPGQQAPELLVRDVVALPVFDALGRAHILHSPAANASGPGGRSTFQLRQIDLASGAPRDLGTIVQLSISPGATHLVLARPGRALESLTVDGQVRALPGSPSAAMRFVGEDVCWVDDRRLDCALVEGGAPVHPTDRLVLKLFPLPSADGKPDILAVTIDLSTRPPVEFLQFWRVRLRPRPGEPGEVLLGRGRPLGDVVVSGDSDWFAFVDLPPSGEPQLRLLSAAAPSETTLTLEPGPSDFEDERLASYGWSDPRFRPGHDEIWSLGPGGQLAILRADGSRTVHRPPGVVRRAPDLMEWVSDRLDFYPVEDSDPAKPTPDVVKFRNMFSSDGRWWVYREGDGVQLGDANDPAASARMQVTGGDARGVVDIRGQDRLLLWSSAGGQRVQVRLYTRDALSLLGTVDEVRQLVVGARGVLALTGFQSPGSQALTPGTLVLLGLGADRAPLVIGQNVTQFALLTGCPTCDPISAGTRLAYTIHARVPWKYDGLWLGELP